MARPRTSRLTTAGSSPRRSRPWKRISPPPMRATPAGRMPRMARASVVLPQPLSPTSPTTSPAAMSRLIPSSTRATPRSVANSHPQVPHAEQLSHRRSAWLRRMPRIEHVAQAVAQQVEAHDGEEDGQARRRRVPPGVGQELARLGDRPAPLRRRRRRAEPEEAERGRGQDGEAHADRGAHDDGRGDVGQHVQGHQPRGEAPSAAVVSMKTSFCSARVSA